MALDEILKYKPQRPKQLPEESLAEVMVDEFSDKCPITPEKSVSDPGALLLDAESDPLTTTHDYDVNSNSNQGSVDRCYQGHNGIAMSDFSEEGSLEHEVEEAEGRKRVRSITASADESDRSHTKKPKLIRVRSDLASLSKETGVCESPVVFQVCTRIFTA